jgi:hypothetical protein
MNNVVKILISLIALRLVIPIGFILIVGEWFRAKQIAQLKT